MENKVVGFYVLWRVPELDARYDDLATLATSLNVDEKYVAKAPRKRGAWEQATNLGKSFRIEAPAHLVEQVRQQYGAAPTVRLETVIVSRSAPNLIRHIVRRVTIPASDTLTGDKRQLAETQLDTQTVCIMEFDTGTEKMRSTGYQELHDFGGWVNGNLKDIIVKLHDDVDKAMNRDNGAKVREGIRNFLLDNHGTLQTAGGAYFLPYRDNVLPQLKAMKVYVEALTDWVTKRNDSGQPADRASFTIIPLMSNGDTFEARLDVAHNAIQLFKEELQEIVSEVQPILQSARTENVSNNIRERVTLKFMEINQKVSSYREALGDDLAALNVYLTSAAQFIAQAQTWTDYKAKDETEVSQDPATV